MLYAIILFAFLITVIGAVRFRNAPLRRIDAYNGMVLSVSQAVESGRAMHLSFGSSAVRDASTLAAVATAEILYALSLRASLGDKPPFVTLSDPITLGLSQDILRKAYRARGRLAFYRGAQSRWYPPGMAFAAGAGTAVLTGDASTNILTGNYGAELMLLAENALRYNRYVVAQSSNDRLDGQAVAYAVSDAPLIGEELYASAAYLSQTPVAVGGVVAQDVLRILVVLALIGLAILSFLGAKF